jgi:hypothetical protein
MLTRVAAATFIVIATAGHASGGEVIELGRAAQVGCCTSIFAIDPATGTYRILWSNVFSGVLGGPPGVWRTYDIDNQRWFALIGAASPSSISLDTYDMAVQSTTHIRLNVCCGPIEFDRTGNRILLFLTNPITSSMATGVYSINLTTGNSSLLFPANLPFAPGTVYDAGAYDPARQRWYFAALSQLYVVDVPAATVRTIQLGCCGPLAFDSVNNRLIGLGVSELFSIDPDSGTTNSLSQVTFNFFSREAFAFDAYAQRFYALTSSPSSLYTVDLATRTSTRVSVASCCGPLAIANVAPIPALGPSEKAFLVMSIVAVAVSVLRLRAT